MELRVLQYFLAVAKEQSFSGAAEFLHLSQPTLSRQIKDMEEELGKQLLVRGKRKIMLTEEGIILRKRAEEILDLVQKTEKEITISNQTVTGDIYIGSGESEGVRLLIKAGMRLQKKYPDIHLHVVSGDSIDLMERLDKGLFDFAVVWDPTDVSNYESIQLPYEDSISLLMPADCTLAHKDSIELTDLYHIPLIVSRHQMKNDAFTALYKASGMKLNIVATYNLMFNASLMVQEGMGYAIGFNHIIDTGSTRNLTYRPITHYPALHMHLVWKKYQIFSKASQLFLQEVRDMFSNGAHE